MNEDTIKGQWRQISGKVRERFGELTDDELQQINGRTEVMLGKLQEKYGYTREQAADAWNKFTNELDGVTDQQRMK
jgi:bacteriocin-like protein